MEYIVDNIVGLGKVENKRLSEIAEIQNFIFPSAVDPGIPFDISYEAVNLSPQDQTLFGYIQDLSTQQQMPGSYWEFIVHTGQFYFHILSFSDGITEQFVGEAVLGHKEYPEICSWIDSKGGPNVLSIMDVFVIIDSYVYITPPSGYTFIPTLQNVFGVIDYYFGFDGDEATGCDYFLGGN